MKIIIMKDEAGEFCENKDKAKKLREEVILPALKDGEAVTIDFRGVTGATQSFVHALVSEALRRFPETVYDNLFFRSANDEVKQIISIVFSYMQRG